MSLALPDYSNLTQGIGNQYGQKEKVVNEKVIVKANLKYVRVSPYKLRKVADEVRNLTALEAIARLRLMPQKSAGIFFKLFKSCNCKRSK